MNISRPILAGAALFALALPITAAAQTTPGAPASTTAHGHHAHVGLNGHALKGIALSDAQKQQFAQLRTAYRTAHPKGSTPDPTARKALRDQMLNILTPDQRTQYDANVKTMRESRKHQENPGGPFASPTPSPAV
ncbi:MAG: hypothetical protein M3R30_04430 [Candidatus Eremiobacteraeota bacterium]|nr:hypothetical protein [Candidatus Eremiobacteraeota bacterium]